MPKHSHTLTPSGSISVKTQPTVNGGTCTISSSGAHRHTFNSRVGATTGNYAASPPTSSNSGTPNTYTDLIENGGAHTHTVPNHTHSVSGGAYTFTGTSNQATSEKGSTTAFSVTTEPKYVGVYAWKRTA